MKSPPHMKEMLLFYLLHISEEGSFNASSERKKWRRAGVRK